MKNKLKTIAMLETNSEHRKYCAYFVHGLVMTYNIKLKYAVKIWHYLENIDNARYC